MIKFVYYINFFFVLKIYNSKIVKIEFINIDVDTIEFMNNNGIKNNLNEINTCCLDLILIIKRKFIKFRNQKKLTKNINIIVF